MAFLTAEHRLSERTACKLLHPTDEDLAYCHLLVEIPTDSRQPSMNLGQAVAVCLYELAARAEDSGGAKKSADKGRIFARAPEKRPSGAKAPLLRPALPAPFGSAQGRLVSSCPDITPGSTEAPGGLHGSASLAATSGELELLAGFVEETMLAANYSPAACAKANRHDLHLLLRRLVLTRRDARRILGLFRRVLWRLRHPADAE